MVSERTDFGDIIASRVPKIKLIQETDTSPTTTPIFDGFDLPQVGQHFEFTYNDCEEYQEALCLSVGKEDIFVSMV